MNGFIFGRQELLSQLLLEPGFYSNWRFLHFSWTSWVLLKLVPFLIRMIQTLVTDEPLPGFFFYKFSTIAICGMKQRECCYGEAMMQLWQNNWSSSITATQNHRRNPEVRSSN